MTRPNPTAATRRDHTPQTVPAPRDANHGHSPSPNAVSTHPTPEPLLLTVAQAAQRLGISRSCRISSILRNDHAPTCSAAG